MAVRPDDFTPPAFHERRPGLLRPVGVDPAGVAGPTPAQIRSRGWRRTGPGLYLPARFADSSLDQQIVEIGMSLPSYSAVTGWAALHWHRVRWAARTTQDDSDPVPVLVYNHRTRNRPDILITAERRLPGDVLEVDGLAVTSPLRSVCYEARYAATLVDAVRWLDLALASDIVSIAELALYQVELSAWTGVPQLRDALLLADENCWSPMETEMRLHWIVGLELDQVVSNRPVFDLNGSFIGTPDLLDLETGVVGEYDGGLHLEGRQRAKDIRREGDFRRHGLEYVTMTAADRADPSELLQRTRDARHRARSMPGTRRWTIDAPSWWTPTHTVARRRALDDSQRARLLRRQAG